MILNRLIILNKIIILKLKYHMKYWIYKQKNNKLTLLYFVIINKKLLTILQIYLLIHKFI